MRWPTILLAVIVVGGGLYLAYDEVTKWHEGLVQEAQDRERETHQTQLESLEEEVAALQEELARLMGEGLPEEKLEKVLGQGSVPVSPARERMGCEEIENRIRSFFEFLDQRESVDSSRLFREAMEALAANPPLITGETKDLSTLVQNVAHFYRVLGKNRIRFVRSILDEESEVLEPVMAAFYEWFTAGAGCGERIKGRPSLETLYEYAGFFLNTLGGRSYLLRRDSRIRTLTTYYSVLIVDRANDQVLNRHGIDIRPYIDLAAYDIRNQRGIAYRKQYGETLEGLRQKYAGKG